jgi:adenine-specific DNA-methyltransferase
VEDERVKRTRIESRQLALRLWEGGTNDMISIETSSRGEVFTRRWVVDLILDLAGYEPSRDLAALRALEPSCGNGAFLVPMIERLVESCAAHGHDLGTISRSIRAFDISSVNAELACKAAAAVLCEAGASSSMANSIADGWISTGDFLLSPTEEAAFDFVLGNPPYVRLEDISDELGKAYREAWPTMRGRSDLFVGFIEAGLRKLLPNGVLSYIVADRWMQNQYGRGLRELIAKEFSMDVVLTMHDVDAFEEQVSAYPAITVLRNAKQSKAVVAVAGREFDEPEGRKFRSFAVSRRKVFETTKVSAARLPGWFDGSRSWPTGTPANLSLVAELERRFPPLEEESTGTRVGVGVASGCDEVFLTRDPNAVEPDRLLPLLTTRDTVSGEAKWSGTFLVNPWEDGRLVDLDLFPRLEQYLDNHSDLVRNRHVARSTPERWYRTIDRVEPGLLGSKKLVIPDLKAYLQPVLDNGTTYPHHGLYFVTSEHWDLEVLGGLLLSDIAELFVSTYCVKMRGGCFRFQAQYLRRIRVPELVSLKNSDRLKLRSAFRSRDRGSASSIARRLYGVGSEELRVK